MPLFEGNVDSLADGTLLGWVLDRGDPGGRLVVTARIDGVCIGLARAEDFRADVAAVGKGSGRHGFEIVLSRHARAVLRHRLKRSLRQRPLRLDVHTQTDGRLGARRAWRTLSREEASDLHAGMRTARRPAPPATIGAVDRIDQSVITGWCVHPLAGHVAPSVALDLVVDDVWVDTTVARRQPPWHRSVTALSQAGAEPLQWLRFRFAVPPWLADGREHVIAVVAREGNDLPIDGPLPVRLGERAGRASVFALPPLVAAEDGPVATDGPRAGEYEAWIGAAEPVDRPPRPEGGWPAASVLIATRGTRASDRAALAETQAALDRQGIETERIVYGPAAPRGERTLTRAVARASGTVLLLCEAGDVIARDAVKAVLSAVAADPGAAVVFGDDDIVDAMGVRRTPRFKTAYCPDRALTDDIFSGLTALRAAEAVAACSRSPAPVSAGTLALKVARAAGSKAVRHLPRVLAHRSGGPAGPDRWTAGFIAALLSEEARQRGMPAPAVVTDPARRVVWPYPHERPAVSVIIPTRDAAHLFEPLVRDVLAQADAFEGAVEVVIIDNDSAEDETFAALDRLAADRRVRALSWPDAFNFSAANNRAVEQCRGSVIVFMNNDIAAPAAGMLEELSRQALRPDVGAVGARLSYADGTNQHCGIGLGIGGVGSHLLKHHPDIGRADHGRFRHVQTVSAVTAALMAMRREVFEGVGGFDEALPLAYNDVDLCLRVTVETGLRVVFTPFAAAYHLESRSRGLDTAPAKRARLGRDKALMRARWGDRLLADPYLSPHHALDSRDLRPAIPRPANAPERPAAAAQ